MSIQERHNTFVEKYGHKPSYASVVIQWKDSGMFGTMEAVTIKLSSDLDEQDDEILYYADGLSDLIAITKDNGEDFYVLEETIEFLKSLD